jgi:hypothetical protein
MADNPQRFFTGYIAHVAIWDANLSDSDSASLGRGVSPLSVRPANLVAYWPLVNRGEQRNLASAKSRAGQPLPVFSAGTQAGTLTGVRYSSWNPPVAQFTRKFAPKIFLPVAAAPTNKLRSQISFLKPYTGILPVANG